MDIAEIIVRAVDLVLAIFPTGSPSDGGATRRIHKKPLPLKAAIEGGSRTFSLAEQDDGCVVDLHTSDRLLVTLAAHPTPDVAARLVEPDAGKLRVFENVTYDEWLHVGCRVVGAGEGILEIEYLRSDSSVDSTWSLVLRVTDSPGCTSNGAVGRCGEDLQSEWSSTR